MGINNFFITEPAFNPDYSRASVYKSINHIQEMYKTKASILNMDPSSGFVCSDYNIGTSNTSISSLYTFIDCSGVNIFGEKLTEAFNSVNSAITSFPDTYVSNWLSSSVGDTNSYTLNELVISNILDSIKDNKSIRFSEEIVDRIDKLIEYSHDEWPEQDPLDPRSLQAFSNFLSTVENNYLPSIVFSQSGNIVAEWSTAKNKKIVAEFTPDADAKFVIFSPYKKNSNKTSRISGITDIDDLMNFISSQGLTDCLSEQTSTCLVAI